ncbi:MAG: DUF5011 domain-containing protein [Bacteroidia bacterium]|nr:DUF5011 domain-containing protein [Bacteroidia bacterium]
MKKQLIAVATIMFVGGTMLMTSCKKDDTTSPTITLKGLSTETVIFGTAFVDPGVTASDDKDGDITLNVSTTGAVDQNKAGSYTITYKVADAAGNEAVQTRTVIVKFINSSLAANTWSGKDSCSPGPSPSSTYTITINASSSNTADITMVDFGAFASPLTVSATISGSTGQTFTIPSQTVSSVLFSGSGTVSSNGKTITYSYTATDGSGTQNCTMTLTRP